MVKLFRDAYPLIREEYSRDHQFAVDLIRMFLKDANGNTVEEYLCTGMIDITYNGNVYTAQGEFLGYSAIQEDYDVKVGKITISLSGVDNDFASRFSNIDQVGSEIRVGKVFLDLNTLDIISDYAIVMYIGEIYNVSIQENAETCTINVECASVFADFDRTAGRRTNDWSNWYFQGTRYDTAMEKAGFVGNTEFLWGRIE
jgi:hypothetical protein